MYISLSVLNNYNLIIVAIVHSLSHVTLSHSLQHHGLQHTSALCPPLSPGICSNSFPLSWWCYVTISFSDIPFSFCPPFVPASRSMSQLFLSGGQSIGASASASALPMNIQFWFPLGWTGLITLKTKGLSRVFSRTTAFFMSQLSHLFKTTGLIIVLNIWTFVKKMISHFANKMWLTRFGY